MNDGLGGIKLICAMQVCLLAILFEKVRTSITYRMYQFIMSGNLSMPMNSVIYVKQHDNMHFGMGFKPIMVLTKGQIMGRFDKNGYERISELLEKRLPEDVNRLIYLTIDTNDQRGENWNDRNEYFVSDVNCNNIAGESHLGTLLFYKYCQWQMRDDNDGRLRPMSWDWASNLLFIAIFMVTSRIQCQNPYEQNVGTDNCTSLSSIYSLHGESDRATDFSDKKSGYNARPWNALDFLDLLPPSEQLNYQKMQRIIDRKTIYEMMPTQRAHGVSTEQKVIHFKDARIYNQSHVAIPQPDQGALKQMPFVNYNKKMQEKGNRLWNY